MPPVELGLLLPIGGGRWDEVERVARLADAAGFDVLWVGDHLAYPPAAAPLESWTVLSAVAPLTKATLATVTVAVAFRPAGLFAKMATALHHVSGGRYRCLLGAGADEREHVAFGLPFGTPRERVDRLADYATVCRSLWADDRPVDHDGAAAQLRGAVNRPQPRTPIELGFGGTGPRIADLAATIGDELCVGLVADVAPVAAQLAEACRRSRRRVRCSVLAPFVVDGAQHPLSDHPRNLNVGRDDLADQLRRYRDLDVTTTYLVPVGRGGADRAAERVDEVRDLAGDVAAG